MIRKEISSSLENKTINIELREMFTAFPPQKGEEE